MRFCSSSRFLLGFKGEGSGKFRACSLGIGDQGFSSLLGILEQSSLRCLSVGFFSLGNEGQGST